MKFGLCGGFDEAKLASECGFDYIEMGVQGLLDSNNAAEGTFKENLANLKDLPVPCKALNCLLPGSIKVAGPDVSVEQYEQYIERVMLRAGKAGVEKIVFGSGNSRKCPEGFSMQTARQQIKDFAACCAKYAGANGVTVVLEPLNKLETNMFNSVVDCAALVREIDHPAFRLLVDGYHWGMDKQTAAEITSCAGLFAHTHMATWPRRLAPGAENCEIDSFFAPLLETGYDSTMSFEGNRPADASILTRSLEIMKESVGALRPAVC